MNMKISAVYVFPNKNVCVFNEMGEQIPRLQGVYSKKLHAKILKESDEGTEWHMKPQ